MLCVKKPNTQRMAEIRGPLARLVKLESYGCDLETARNAPLQFQDHNHTHFNLGHILCTGRTRSVLDSLTEVPHIAVPSSYSKLSTSSS